MRKTDTRSKILAAARELTEEKQVFSSRDLHERAGVDEVKIHDHLKRMIPAGEIIRTAPGVFVHPGEIREDHPVTLTVLLDFSLKLERGDDEMIFTRNEARMLKAALGGG